MVMVMVMVMMVINNGNGDGNDCSDDGDGNDDCDDDYDGDGNDDCDGDNDDDGNDDGDDNGVIMMMVMAIITIVSSYLLQGLKEPGADIDVGDKKLPYPYKKKTSTVTKSDARQSPSHTENHTAPSTQKSPVKRDVTPKYAIVHRGLLDLQNFTNAR